MSMPDEPADRPVEAPLDSEPLAAIQEQDDKQEQVTVELTDIKASGLPARVGLFSGVFYVRVKGGKVPKRTKTAKYVKADEFVVQWNETIRLSGLESTKVEIEVYAKRFFFSYKIIKKTESKESLADLLEHGETPVELELLEEGQAAGKLLFKISKSAGEAKVRAPPEPMDSPGPVSASVPGSPKQTT